MYIGSSINIGNRLVDHLVYNNTNERLLRALNKYGLENFIFAVVEFCDLEVLLQREQHYLDWLFTLPADLRYNFARFAEAPFKGLTHTPESKAQMSDSISGRTHTPESKAQMSISQQLVDRSGANHPMYGNVAANAQTVNVYSIDNVLVSSFTSQVACAKWLDVSECTVRNYVKSGKVFRKQYLIVRSSVGAL
jgi:group I intron endonuclease